MSQAQDRFEGEWLGARAAAAQLGVTLATLYSYVSRGLLHPLATPHSHAKRYRRDEVQRLAQRHAAAREPRRVAGAALDHGLPVLESSLGLIEHGRLSYRGHDAITLAATATLENAAALLWGVDPAVLRPASAASAPSAPSAQSTPAGASAWPRARRSGLARGSPMNALAEFHRAAAVPTERLGIDDGVHGAWHWVHAMLWATTGARPGRRALPLHRQLAAVWQLAPAAAEPLRRALVLCADHELNVSSFTARCVASTGATLAASVGAGLAALTGPRHGGLTARIEAFWPQIESLPARPEALRRRLAAGPLPPGFGHPLYPEGDPRCRALLEQLPRDHRRDRFVGAVQEQFGQAPVIDFGLVALRRALGAPAGAAFAIFAIGRTVGWIAHALEQRASGVLIRPRARYTGPPSSSGP